jgi:putative aminopeptidase FrvX
MRARDLESLSTLIQAPSPSGFEQPASAVFRDLVAPFADDVSTDVMGSVLALLKGKGDGPSVMLAGHVDEIGMMVTYTTPEGYLAFRPIGGVDTGVLPALRVRIHTKEGPLLGIVGRKPIHLIEEEERKKVAKVERLFIDVGLPADEVSKRVRVGDPITFDTAFERLGDGMAVSRAFDDKMGAWVAARVLEEVAAKGPAAGDVIAAATVQEEIGSRGAVASTYGLAPDVGIAIDVGHATDYPDMDKRSHGEYTLVAGPIIARGANINHRLFDLLVAAAEKAKVRYQIGAEPRATGTDANPMQLSRGGRAAALVSVPLRYMHTPSEMLSLKDLEATVKLLTRFLLDLKPGEDFTP